MKAFVISWEWSLECCSRKPGGGREGDGEGGIERERGRKGGREGGIEREGGREMGREGQRGREGCEEGKGAEAGEG